MASSTFCNQHTFEQLTMKKVEQPVILITKCSTINYTFILSNNITGLVSSTTRSWSLFSPSLSCKYII